MSDESNSKTEIAFDQFLLPGTEILVNENCLELAIDDLLRDQNAGRDFHVSVVNINHGLNSTDITFNIECLKK